MEEDEGDDIYGGGENEEFQIGAGRNDLSVVDEDEREGESEEEESDSVSAMAAVEDAPKAAFANLVSTGY
jgi:hypothetical protein